MNNPAFRGFLMRQSILNHVSIFHFNGPRGGMTRITWSLGRQAWWAQPTHHLIKPEEKTELSFLTERHAQIVKVVRTLSASTSGKWEWTYTYREDCVPGSVLAAGSWTTAANSICSSKWYMPGTTLNPPYVIAQLTVTTTLSGGFYAQSLHKVDFTIPIVSRVTSTS